MNTNVIAVPALNIVNDATAILRPGMIVTAQLGNKFDSSWSPAAPLLLLHSDAVMFGDAQFTGLYQRTPGEYYIARFVQAHRARTEHQKDTGFEVGIMYCTSAVPFDMETKESAYLSERENAFIAQCIRFHREKVAVLPVAPRYKKDELLDLNHGD